jgi:Fe2+ or Zn2+ uptake regulation protein
MTATDIHGRLSPRRATIVSASRTPHLLARLNLVRSTDTARGSRRDELSEPFTGGHPHLVCQGCGRIEDLDGCVVTDDVLARLTRAVRRSRHLQVMEHEIRLFGLCRECAA